MNLNENYDFFIEKGTILKLIEDLDLTKTIDFIKKEILKKFS